MYAGVGWSCHASGVCVMMLVLQCQCRGDSHRDGSYMPPASTTPCPTPRSFFLAVQRVVTSGDRHTASGSSLVGWTG